MQIFFLSNSWKTSKIITSLSCVPLSPVSSPASRRTALSKAHQVMSTTEFCLPHFIYFLRHSIQKGLKVRTTVPRSAGVKPGLHIRTCSSQTLGRALCRCLQQAQWFWLRRQQRVIGILLYAVSTIVWVSQKVTNNSNFILKNNQNTYQRRWENKT